MFFINKKKISLDVVKQSFNSSIIFTPPPEFSLIQNIKNSVTRATDLIKNNCENNVGCFNNLIRAIDNYIIKFDRILKESNDELFTHYVTIITNLDKSSFDALFDDLRGTFPLEKIKNLESFFTKIQKLISKNNGRTLQLSRPFGFNQINYQETFDQPLHKSSIHNFKYKDKTKEDCDKKYISDDKSYSINLTKLLENHKSTPSSLENKLYSEKLNLKEAFIEIKYLSETESTSKIIERINSKFQLSSKEDAEIFNVLDYLVPIKEHLQNPDIIKNYVDFREIVLKLLFELSSSNISFYIIAAISFKTIKDSEYLNAIFEENLSDNQLFQFFSFVLVNLPDTLKQFYESLVQNDSSELLIINEYFNPDNVKDKLNRLANNYQLYRSSSSLQMLSLFSTLFSKSLSEIELNALEIIFSESNLGVKAPILIKENSPQRRQSLVRELHHSPPSDLSISAAYQNVSNISPIPFNIMPTAVQTFDSLPEIGNDETQFDSMLIIIQDFIKKAQEPNGIIPESILPVVNKLIADANSSFKSINNEKEKTKLRNLTADNCKVEIIKIVNLVEFIFDLAQYLNNEIKPEPNKNLISSFDDKLSWAFNIQQQTFNKKDLKEKAINLLKTNGKFDAQSIEKLTIARDDDTNIKICLPLLEYLFTMLSIYNEKSGQTNIPASILVARLIAQLNSYLKTELLGVLEEKRNQGIHDAANISAPSQSIEFMDNISQDLKFDKSSYNILSDFEISFEIPENHEGTEIFEQAISFYKTMLSKFIFNPNGFKLSVNSLDTDKIFDRIAGLHGTVITQLWFSKPIQEFFKLSKFEIYKDFSSLSECFVNNKSLFAYNQSNNLNICTFFDYDVKFHKQATTNNNDCVFQTSETNEKESVKLFFSKLLDFIEKYFLELNINVTDLNNLKTLLANPAVNLDNFFKALKETVPLSFFQENFKHLYEYHTQYKLSASPGIEFKNKGPIKMDKFCKMEAPFFTHLSLQQLLDVCFMQKELIEHFDNPIGKVTDEKQYTDSHRNYVNFSQSIRDLETEVATRLANITEFKLKNIASNSNNEKDIIENCLLDVNLKPYNIINKDLVSNLDALTNYKKFKPFDLTDKELETLTSSEQQLLTILNELALSEEEQKTIINSTNLTFKDSETNIIEFFTSSSKIIDSEYLRNNSDKSFENIFKKLRKVSDITGQLFIKFDKLDFFKKILTAEVILKSQFENDEYDQAKYNNSIEEQLRIQKIDRSIIKNHGDYTKKIGEIRNALKNFEEYFQLSENEQKLLLKLYNLFITTSDDYKSIRSLKIYNPLILRFEIINKLQTKLSNFDENSKILSTLIARLQCFRDEKLIFTALVKNKREKSFTDLILRSLNQNIEYKSKLNSKTIDNKKDEYVNQIQQELNKLTSYKDNNEKYRLNSKITAIIKLAFDTKKAIEIKQNQYKSGLFENFFNQKNETVEVNSIILNTPKKLFNKFDQLLYSYLMDTNNESILINYSKSIRDNLFDQVVKYLNAKTSSQLQVFEKTVNDIINSNDNTAEILSNSHNNSEMKAEQKPQRHSFLSDIKSGAIKLEKTNSGDDQKPQMSSLFDVINSGKFKLKKTDSVADPKKTSEKTTSNQINIKDSRRSLLNELAAKLQSKAEK